MRLSSQNGEAFKISVILSGALAKSKDLPTQMSNQRWKVLRLRPTASAQDDRNCETLPSSQSEARSRKNRAGFVLILTLYVTV